MLICFERLISFSRINWWFLSKTWQKSQAGLVGKISRSNGKKKIARNFYKDPGTYRPILINIEYINLNLF